MIRLIHDRRPPTKHRPRAVAYTSITKDSAELPVVDGTSLAISMPVSDGWPTAYAFGGRDVDGKLRGRLYRAQPVASPGGVPTYAWEAVATSDGPSARSDAGLAVLADS